MFRSFSLFLLVLEYFNLTLLSCIVVHPHAEIYAILLSLALFDRRKSHCRTKHKSSYLFHINWDIQAMRILEKHVYFWFIVRFLPVITKLVSWLDCTCIFSYVRHIWDYTEFHQHSVNFGNVSIWPINIGHRQRLLKYPSDSHWYDWFYTSCNPPCWPELHLKYKFICSVCFQLFSIVTSYTER